MKHLSLRLALGLALLAGSAPAAAQSPFDGLSAEQRAALVKDDLPYVAADLALTSVPRPSGRRVSLFAGNKLDAWDSWFGVPDSKMTYLPEHGQPIGLNKDENGTISIVTEDGQKAIRISGEPWGGLISKKSYGNYHLRLQYKWGAGFRPDFPRNNGILSHSNGELGAFFSTWMPGMEFEIMPGQVGMTLPVPATVGTGAQRAVDFPIMAKVRVGHDPSLAFPSRRFMPSGKLTPLSFPAGMISPHRDAEKPVGEWNTLDLYVVGDRAIHVVNGVPVMAVDDIEMRGPAGKYAPLREGRIQLQSESAETFFREISLEPINRLPTIVQKPRRR